MKKADIRLGGKYVARVSGDIVTVRVDRIEEKKNWRGKEETCYHVYNLKTGRKTVFRSASKFRSEVRSAVPKATLEAVQTSLLNSEPLPVTVQEPTEAPRVDFCNWCSDPKNPDPESHPNGQYEHIPKTRKLTNAQSAAGYRGDNLHYHGEEADPLRPETPPPVETPAAEDPDMKFICWAQQAAVEIVNYHRKNDHRISEDELQAFGKGYRQGYLKAVADLRMHRLLAAK